MALVRPLAQARAEGHHRLRVTLDLELLAHAARQIHERLDAPTCERLGITNRVVPASRLQEETMTLARQLASGPTVAFRYMKQNLDRAMRTDLDTCLAAEARGVVATATTEDHQEAVRAFIEKRPPRFRGR